MAAFAGALGLLFIAHLVFERRLKVLLASVATAATQPLWSLITWLDASDTRSPETIEQTPTQSNLLGAFSLANCKPFHANGSPNICTE
ncbi:MAG: hypothetical protein KF871_03725 [Hydrogenophaga sp.]|uniref:hypothetical protein n=1 Tax=Hydrogenophaga sp. TaxID=1904254 RepID=UPI001DFF3683|nr:hypothetical protein [Hydrogenophaga sp.]MBX3608981.1 hypothetical protein [Hydrogenophaga sp.]